MVQVPDYTYTTANGQIAITGYTGTNRTAIIPDTVGGLPVTSIGANAFAGQTSLVNVIIPASITELGDHAFAFCSNLTGAYFLGTPPLVGANSFEGDKQTTVYQQYSWWWDPEEWGSTFGGRPVAVFPYGFSVNSDHTVTITSYSGTDTEVDIPSSIADLPVTCIGRSAFSEVEMWFDSYQLTRVTIPYGVLTIDDLAFADNRRLTNVSIPNTVIAIGMAAFSYCYSLTNLVIPDSVCAIGDRAFSSCELLARVTLGAHLTSLGSYVFGYCSSLMDFVVHSNNPAFSSVDGVLFSKEPAMLVQYPCGRTGSYTIPDDVTEIADGAFVVCGGLSALTIPASMRKIGDIVFICRNLTDIYFNGNAPTTTGARWIYSGSPTIYYLPGATGWGTTFGGYPVRAQPYLFSTNHGVLVITEYHGSGGAVSLPDTLAGLTVSSIGSQAFYGADITRLVIADSVTNMGNFAFANCTNLTGVVIGKGLATLGFGTFEGCVRLSSVSLNAGLPFVAEGMFQSCVSLSEVALPASVTSIGDGAFCGCTNLVSVTKPTGITNIGYKAFYACTLLRE
jgi:hypothetical protein